MVGCFASSLTSTGTGKEVQEGQTITFTVTPNSMVNVDTTLVLNVQGKALGAVTSLASAADFEATPAITFAQGSTAAQTITMKVATDTAVEGREAYSVDVIDTTAYATRGNQVTGVITDKLPTLSLSQNVSTVNEGSTVTYTVTSDEAAPTGGITVPFTVAGTATSGTDYTALTASSVTIAAGAKTGTVTLTTIADTATEGDETVIVTLGTVTNASVSDTAKTVTTTVSDTSKALGTAEMTLTGATSVDEGSAVTYTVTLGAAAATALAIPYTLSGTATSGTDFTGSTGTITVASGAKTGTLTLTTTADSTTEGAEAVTVTLGTVGGFVAASGQGAVTTTINDTSLTVSGTSFSLTTGVDNITGTAGDDTITSTNSYTDGANNTTSTLSAADAINGGAGVDTAALIFEGDFANNTDITAAAGTFTAVEVVTVRNLLTVDGTGDTITFDGTNAVGHTKLVSDRSTAPVAFTNAANGSTIGIWGNESATGNVSVTYKTASNNVILEVSGGTKTSTFTNSTSSAAPTSVTINSLGSVANSLGALDFGGSAVTSLAINATARFTTTDLGNSTTDFATAGAAMTVSGSAVNSSTGSQAVTVGTLNNKIFTVDASGLTAGGLSATLHTALTSLKGGLGNDNISTAALTVTTLQAVNAGAGTGDILTVSASGDVDTLAEGKVYSGFEIVKVADGVSVDLDNLATYNTITGLSLTTGGTLTNVTATQAANVTVSTGGNSPTITIKDATTSGQIDTLKLFLNDNDTASANTIALGTPVFAGVEVLELNVTSGDTGTVTALTSAAQLTTINLTGAGNVSVTSGALALQTNFKVDASTSTGANTLDFTNATTSGFAYVGNLKVDTVTLGIRGDNSISTGTGKDVITAVAKTGGTNSDTITMGADADTFDFGTQVGNDAFEKTIFKFASTDSKIVSSATQGYEANNMDNIASIANDADAAAAAGQVFYIDTDKSATAVTAGTTAVTFGTTTVSNAYDFYVYAPATGTDAYVYQDTNGDKVISDGEFGIKLIGTTNKWTAGEFAMDGSTGNLLYTSAV